MGKITPRLNAFILLALLIIPTGMFSSAEREIHVDISIDFISRSVACTSGPKGAINNSISGEFKEYKSSWSGPDSFMISSEDISGLGVGIHHITVAYDN